MAGLHDHFDRGGFCACCGTLWPCAAVRKAFLAQRAARDTLAQRAAAEDPPSDPDPWFGDPP